MFAMEYQLGKWKFTWPRVLYMLSQMPRAIEHVADGAKKIIETVWLAAIHVYMYLKYRKHK